MLLKIAVFHNDNENIASVRLRSIYLFDYIANKKIQILRNKSFFTTLNCNFFHFHMQYSPVDILKVFFLRVLGKKVIFDVDDIPTSLIYKFFFILKMNLASKISVDTKARINYLKKFTLFKKKFFLLNDTIDLNPLEYNRIKSKNFLQLENNFFWTGHEDNYHSIKEFVELVSNMKNTNITILTNINNKFQKLKFENIKYIQWKKNIAFKVSKYCNFSILNHSNNFLSNLKSENKMVLSIALGIIPFVSNTPSYRILAKKLDAEILIYKNFNEIFQKIEILDIKWQEDFILRAQKYIKKEYSNNVLFSKFLKEVI